MRTVLLSAIMGALILSASMTLAKAPAKQPTEPKRCPNLQATDKLIAQAQLKMQAAQKANEYDLPGHAQKAKELLDQAGKELALADAANNSSR
jgi:hypothetical protein